MLQGKIVQIRHTQLKIHVDRFGGSRLNRLKLSNCDTSDEIV